MSDTYIVVRVAETHEGDRVTDVGVLRKALHQAIEDHGIVAGDLVLKKKPNYVGAAQSGSTKDAKKHWAIVNDLYSDIIARSKKLAAKQKKREKKS